MLAISPYRQTDLLLAKRRCSSFVRRYPDVLPPLLRSCELTVLVPLYAESTSRVRALIEAYAAQCVPLGSFELVFIVNNPPAQEAHDLARVIEQNQKCLRILKRKYSIPVHVIDASSPGREIPEGNVGKARNIGLHLVAARYLAQSREGIILHTDADTFPTKTDYLRKVMKELKPPHCFGAAGGLAFVLDLDGKSKQDIAFFERHLVTLRAYFTWRYLVQSLHLKDLTPLVWPTRFSGAHMIVKAIAAVCAGGVPVVKGGEDMQFGEQLSLFAKRYQARILPRRDTWYLRTAVRESRRTGASFGSVLLSIKKRKGRLVAPDPYAPLYAQFVNDILLTLQKTRGDLALLVPLLKSWSMANSPRTHKAFLELSVELQGKRGAEARLNAFRRWRDAQTSPRIASFIRRTYNTRYPSTPLSFSRVAALKSLVFKDPKRKAYVQNAEKYFFDFKLR